jgi:murein DD-endopeptidase MepM/ murein hydrolase activator NlpD
MHQGVDFGAASGSPIMAAASGVVGFAARHGGHGNYVRLVHNKELSTGYAHMSRFAVKPGQRVSQGQVIGYVGSTGISTGPHLHYEIWLRGKPVNPTQLKFVGGSQLSGADLTRFKAMLGRLEGLAVTGAAAVSAAKSR